MSGHESTILHFAGPIDVAACVRAVTHLGMPLEHLEQRDAGPLSVLTARVAGRLEANQTHELTQWAESAGLHLTLANGATGLVEAAIAVTLLGKIGLGPALLAVTEHLQRRGFHVTETRGVGRNDTHGVELLVRPRDPASNGSDGELAQLRQELLQASRDWNMDVAVQKNDFFRKNRRLVCLDVDSTFVQGEFIDELAELAGVKPQVAEITSRAMRGELDFQAALRERVALLEGLPMERALTLCERFVLSPGAEDLVRSLRRLGVRVGLVSGGFDFFVDMLRSRFGLDFAFANQLEVADDRLTGKVLGAIVDGQRKAQILRDMAAVFRIDLRQTVAVGDGANDIFMLEAAGLGIAYQAKPKLLAHADAYFLHHDRLDTMLYLMGFDPPEVKDACREC